jgi:hypothetical protein
MCYTLQRMQVAATINSGNRSVSSGGGGGLFGSGRDVPDVAGLQVWIEKAWAAGNNTTNYSLLLLLLLLPQH